MFKKSLLYLFPLLATIVFAVLQGNYKISNGVDLPAYNGLIALSFFSFIVIVFVQVVRALIRAFRPHAKATAKSSATTNHATTKNTFYKSTWAIPAQYFLAVTSLVVLSISIVSQFVVLPQAIIDNALMFIQLEAVASGLAFILFLRWHYGSYHNLEVAGHHVATSAKMALLDYFIPIRNIYKPYVHMKELYADSMTKGAHFDDSQLLTIWVISFVLRYATTIYIKLATTHSDLVGELSYWVILVSLAADAAFSICNIILIKRISSAQEATLTK